MPKTFGPEKPFMSVRFAKTRGTGQYFFKTAMRASFLFSFLQNPSKNFKGYKLVKKKMPAHGS
jgi:hypothetical protein